ncbi:MAG: hypothetical protein NZT92_00710 [Abditibacteriales bacterium]|nr:hypothetical protein [Abditibacteriales bacterium]MDW8364623.1 hypothetical protein [Abditibacteriales bacterium]
MTSRYISAGEAAAIVLAKEESASLVLMDDRLARAAAQGLRQHGTAHRGQRAAQRAWGVWRAA